MYTVNHFKDLSLDVIEQRKTYCQSRTCHFSPGPKAMPALSWVWGHVGNLLGRQRAKGDDWSNAKETLKRGKKMFAAHISGSQSLPSKYLPPLASKLHWSEGTAGRPVNHASVRASDFSQRLAWLEPRRHRSWHMSKHMYMCMWVCMYALHMYIYIYTIYIYTYYIIYTYIKCVAWVYICHVHIIYTVKVIERLMIPWKPALASGGATT